MLPTVMVNGSECSLLITSEYTSTSDRVADVLSGHF